VAVIPAKSVGNWAGIRLSHADILENMACKVNGFVKLWH